MLSDEENARLVELDEAIRRLSPRSNRASLENHRRYHDLLRSSLTLYEDVVRRCRREQRELRGEQYEDLRRLAGQALMELGGQSHPALVSLRDYDHHRVGPFLGVSDEGSAVDAIAAAALGSPKMRVLGPCEPLEVGVALDAERLGAVGEVAVGPVEYRQIRLGCMGRILTSTNVGTRVNLRFFKQRPRIEIPRTGAVEAVVERALQEAIPALEPFFSTPDEEPRPLTVFVHFASGSRRTWRLDVLRSMKEAVATATFCAPQVHRLGLLTLVRRSWIGVKAAQAAIELASEAGLHEVAVQGVVRREAEEQVSMPDLLNFFTPQQTTRLLRFAREHEIHLTSWNLVDPQTVARNIWGPLQVARGMGLELGKYGLSPLTLEQADAVMELIQAWYEEWTAAPVLYVDLPIMGSTSVYLEPTMVAGIERWLEIVAKHAIPVVLIDTADKSRGRRLLKRSVSDRVGILAPEDIVRVDSFAKRLGIKVLWAGGLSLADCYQLGKYQVFGVYVTTSVSASRALTEGYRHDPMLASEKEPTFEGVLRAKLLLEAGFLTTRLKDRGRSEIAEELKEACYKLIRSLRGDGQTDAATMQAEEDQVAVLATEAWTAILGRSPASS